jgi:hypothetical protein
MQPAINEEPRSRFYPPHLLIEAKFFQDAAKMLVGKQRDVVMPVPCDFADLPGIRETTHMVRGFQNRHALAALREAQRERQAQQAPTDDPEMFARL